MTNAGVFGLAVCAFAVGVASAPWLGKANAAGPSLREDENSYLCVDAHSAADLNHKLNAAGARGWRVVGASPGPEGSVWCLGRPGPSPLRDAK